MVKSSRPHGERRRVVSIWSIGWAAAWTFMFGLPDALRLSSGTSQLWLSGLAAAVAIGITAAAASRGAAPARRAALGAASVVATTAVLAALFDGVLTFVGGLLLGGTIATFATHAGEAGNRWLAVACGAVVWTVCALLSMLVGWVLITWMVRSFEPFPGGTMAAVVLTWGGAGAIGGAIWGGVISHLSTGRGAVWPTHVR